MAAAAGTWAFSLPVLNKMRALLLRDASATDCVQEAMADIENDEETGSYVVGRGGYPNKDGLIQCDAAIMEGHPCHFGAVAALSGVGTPLAVARKVMERNTHSFLVGDGAAAFAREQGFIVEDNESMMTEWSAEVYKEYLEKKKSPKGHDTLGLIALDIHGNITVGVSTSGAPLKYPGRVGDSPLPGCGLYADNQLCLSAVSHFLSKCHWILIAMGTWQPFTSTGDGDQIMCFCPCFHVVLLMKQGLSPMDACQTVLEDILQRVGKENMFELGIIAMNMKGEAGAASSMPFPYCIWSQGQDSIEELMQQPCKL
uniref:N(4)-(Beta-N-acetylglucosaminyl)-L-asparaginase-like n=1 Tax=Crocodylus porosus TaxID=8502 RepID=A0A7M4FZG1_CROPO